MYNINIIITHVTAIDRVILLQRILQYSLGRCRVIIILFIAYDKSFFYIYNLYYVNWLIGTKFDSNLCGISSLRVTTCIHSNVRQPHDRIEHIYRSPDRWSIQTFVSNIIILLLLLCFILK